jgi:ornithine carbamoyltransferase
MTRHLLDVIDVDADEVTAILDLSERPIAELDRPLEGSGAALVFEKPSNRTRHSTEMAVVQLGGHPVYTRGDEIGFDVREPVEDVARILAGYHAMIAARVFDHHVLTRMTAVVDVPVVNLLSDRSHPLQAFADALTMRQTLGPLADRTVAWVGDYNNVARSLGEIASLLGMHLRFACPAGFDPSAAELARFETLGARSVVLDATPAAVLTGADVVHTDTWVSMGQEHDKAERIEIFSPFTVDASMMALAAPDAWFMHCLPAYRGLEVTADVIDGPRSLVIAQGHNRLHAARGVMAFLLRNQAQPGGRS